MGLRRASLGCPMVLLLSLIACDRRQPFEPAIHAAATGAGAALKAPSNTKAVPVSESRIDVSWTDNSTNETGFEVHRSVSGPAGTFTLRVTTDANISSYGDAGLNAATPYCYRGPRVPSRRREDALLPFLHRSVRHTAGATASGCALPIGREAHEQPLHRADVVRQLDR